ncbi:MAG TPA: sulfite exporter TauE/SafE family protein [Caulobacterales bacterium]|jgi:uncharacterized membrane protein YfcA|nr:sulfite exporter TauE/SafE family protein [Caulobacterales bacterium]
MIDDPWFYALAIPAVVMLGLAKGGFAGAGAAAMPMVALTISPVRAAAILLPILIVQDVVSVWAFRRTWDKRILAIMLPGAAIGIFLGYLLAAKVSASVILGVLGALSILFALYRLYLSHGAPARAPRPHAPIIDVIWGSIAGIASGFTSQVAHAGQPPFHMWVLPKNLPRESLVGTTAIYFAIINWLKVPAYIALNQFTPANLTTTAVLLPAAIAGTLAGVWLVRRVDAERFYTLIYLMMIVVGAALLWEVFA